MTCSDWFLVPVSSAVKSNLTNCCCHNLFKCALNALTVQASTTELVSCSKYLHAEIFKVQNNVRGKYSYFL